MSLIQNSASGTVSAFQILQKSSGNQLMQGTNHISEKLDEMRYWCATIAKINFNFVDSIDVKDNKAATWGLDGIMTLLTSTVTKMDVKSELHQSNFFEV